MMTATPLQATQVIGGADTHANTIHVAAIDDLGRELDDQKFPTTPHGYRDALAFLTGHGTLLVIGIEGTSSYGAGLTRAARTAGIEVREVTRPDRALRRMRGKSDPIDAYAAWPTRCSLVAPRPHRRTSRSTRSGPCTSPGSRRSRPAPRR